MITLMLRLLIYIYIYIYIYTILYALYLYAKPYDIVNLVREPRPKVGTEKTAGSEKGGTPIMRSLEDHLDPRHF